MNPVIGARLAEFEDFAKQCLHRVGLLIDQGEQQLLFDAIQCAFPSATCFALARLAGLGLMPRIRSRVCPFKSRQKQLILSA